MKVCWMWWNGWEIDEQVGEWNGERKKERENIDGEIGVMRNERKK